MPKKDPLVRERRKVMAYRFSSDEYAELMICLKTRRYNPDNLGLTDFLSCLVQRYGHQCRDLDSCERDHKLTYTFQPITKQDNAF